MRLQNAVCAVVMAAAMLAATAAASPLPESQVPAPLKTWIAWALHDRDLRDCPVAHDNGAVRTCDWPSRLRLELSGNGGRFELRTKLDAQGWALLPGGDKAWPQDVRVDGRPAPVASHAGTPALYLAAGSYVIAGGFEWTRLPESLAVPQNTGLVSLSVNGAEHTHPTRSADSVWLGRSAPQDLAGDRLALQVYRLVDDDIPLRVVTHIGIEAAGQVREERFGPVLLPDLKPLEIASPLPARIDESGFLNVQLRPGVWSIDVTARAAGPVTDLKLPQLAAPWPAEEVWSFAPHNNLRIVEISGVPAVDPQQAQVPTPWRSNRAYALKSGETLHLSEKQRGDPHPQAGTIALQRQLWLDFDGRGYTVRDSLRGRIGDQWRLDATAPLRLGSVTLDGEPQPITRRSGDDQGVEVRHAALELVAASRIEGRVSRLPVNGWDHEVQGVDTVLRLPPGWRLFAASGVDNVPQTWVGRWSLLDLFAVLIAAAAALRLFGLRWGGLMLLMLLLSWQEAAAPRWSWLNLIATVALLRALPASFRGGRLETWLARYRMLAALVLLLLAIPFALQQARSALYPQLEHAQIPLNPISYQASLKHQVSLNEDAASGEPRPEPMVTEPEQAKEEGARMPTEAPSPPMAAPAVSGRSALSAAQSQAEAAQLSSLRKKAMLAQQAQLSQQAMRRFEPGALTPTGPGLPDWEWTAADLSWSGPVSGAQDFRLWLLPPVLTRLLELLSIVLVAAMLGRCLEWQRPPPPRASGGVAAAALAVLLAGALPHPARAQSADALPTQSLLDQLREKLLAPPECAPDCAEAARLWIGLGTDQVLNLRLSVDVQAPVAVPLPVPALAGGEQGGVWQPQRILVDGSDAALRRDEDGNLWIRLGVGRHEVLLAGDVAGLGQVQLPLPLKPHHVGAQLEGWLLSGIDDNGVAGDALQLLRQSASGGPAPAAESGGQVLPPLLRVTRSLHLGLDWQVDTAVQRLGVAYTAVNTAIPLLPGETVTSEDMRVRDAAVQLSLAPGETSASWTSRLAPAATLSLRAAPRDDVVEVWQFDIAPIWHAEFAGIAPVQHQDNSWWLPSFQPWPGESLQLALSRPQGLNGATLTLDTAQLTLTPGRHASDELLDLRLRSTQGGHYALPLEPGTTVTALTVNGASQPVQLDGGRLVLSLSPGVQQIRVQLRSDRGISAWLRTPAQALGLDGTNARLDLELPQDRWILLLGGPRLGPAVLFWGVLAVLFAIAAMLGRWRELPLRAWQWALLFVGLSQIPVWAAAVVVGWFAALAWRGRNGNTLTARRFKLTQAGLVLLTALVLALLFDAIAAGLLGQPEMQIAGNGSYGHSLHWYQDRCGNSLPQAWVLSTPLWVYRLLMLLWALWLANALLGWLRWAWLQFTAGGLWQRPVAAGPHPPPLQ